MDEELQEEILSLLRSKVDGGSLQAARQLGEYLQKEKMTELINNMDDDELTIQALPD
ncbi:MAG: hypothetical protein HDS25_01210 [Bacteroides sp.]|nr:hypothetical protein [Bacteroides sp.]